MGASHSKQDDEQVFYNQVPIQVITQTKYFPTSSLTTHQVSSELATQLSDTSLSPEVSPTRHAILDQNVRDKISAEAAHLRGHNNDNNNRDNDGDGVGVDLVRREIEAALERENLDRERGMAGDVHADAEGGGTHGDVKNSTVLFGDLEEIRQKVDRYRERASLTVHPGVKQAREAVASCYQANPTTTLNCWSEVTAFRTAVAELEQRYVNSLR